MRHWYLPILLTSCLPYFLLNQQWLLEEKKRKRFSQISILHCSLTFFQQQAMICCQITLSCKCFTALLYSQRQTSFQQKVRVTALSNKGKLDFKQHFTSSSKQPNRQAKRKVFPGVGGPFSLSAGKINCMFNVTERWVNRDFESDLAVKSIFKSKKRFLELCSPDLP